MPAVEGGQHQDSEQTAVPEEARQTHDCGEEATGAGSDKAEVKEAAAGEPAAADCKPIAASAVSEPVNGSVQAAEPATAGASAEAASASLPAAAPSEPAGPSRPIPSRPKYESIEWQLHRAFMARHAAASDGADNATAGGDAPAADGGPPQEQGGGPNPDAAAKSEAEPVTSAPPTSIPPAGVAGAPTPSTAGDSSSARAPAPRPRYEHSSISWQLHTKFMAQRRDGGAPLAGALPAKASEQSDPGSAGPASDTGEPRVRRSPQPSLA